MKKLIALLLACVMVLGLVACGNEPAETTAPNAGGETNAPETTAPAASGEAEAITLKVWAPQEDQVDASSWLLQVEAAFAAAHPEYVITWDNGVCAEGDAKTLITADPAAGADVYMYANDHLGGLIQAGAVAKLGGPFLEQVMADNNETFVGTVTYADGNIYGFPVAPNTWSSGGSTNSNAFYNYDGKKSYKVSYLDSNYVTLDMAITYKASKNLKIFAKGYNLLNEAYCETAGLDDTGNSYKYPAQSRRFLIGAEYSF